MKRPSKAPPKKAQVQKQKPRSFWKTLTSPLYVFVLVVFAFGISTVGRAAEKIKRGVKNRKNNLRNTVESLLTAKAWAYFRPIWQKQGQVGLPAPIEEFDNFVKDAEGRIEKPFRAHDAIKGRVAFWFDVYARFSSQYRIVHDKDNPEIVYGYLDFRPLYRTLPHRMARARAYQLEQRVLKELKDRLSEAMEVHRPRGPKLNEQEKLDIRALMAKFQIDTPEAAAKPIRRVRAQTGQKDAFLKGLHRSRKLIPQIEALFKERGIPVALARLPFVESSYNPNAYSKAGAMGMWQFMPDTAKRFDPKATTWQLVDPIRQSKSAVRMIEILHQNFDDWGLAITSYNSGATRVKRVADANGVTNIDDLLKIPLGRGKLGFAGANFFAEFLAAVLVEAYHKEVFNETEMQVARLKLPRKLQSLFEFEGEKPRPKLKSTTVSGPASGRRGGIPLTVCAKEGHAKRMHRL